MLELLLVLVFLYKLQLVGMLLHLLLNQLCMYQHFQQSLKVQSLDFQ